MAAKAEGGTRGERRWLTPAIVAGCVSGLFALRTAQLLTLAPLLHSPEFLQLSQLASDLAADQELGDMGLRGLFQRYIYMDYAQGTVLTALGTALLSPVLGVTSWAMHATSMLAEGLAFGLLVLLLLRVAGPRALPLGLAPWVVAPGVAVAWQLLPYGNHTEFLWVPLAVALFLARRDLLWRHLAWWLVPTAVLATGLVFYRGSLPVAVALAAVAVWSGSRRVALVGLVTCVGAVIVALACLAGLHGADSFAGWPRENHILGPGVALDTGNLLTAPATLAAGFPGAPRALGSTVPYLVLLLLGAGLLLAKSARGEVQVSGDLHARRFVVLWALASLAAALVDADPQVGHRLNALYALLVCAALLLSVNLSPAIRRGGALVGGLLILAGAIDALPTVRPAAWSASVDFEGVALWRELGIRRADPDDHPYLTRLLREGRGTPDVGLATHHGEACPEPLASRLVGPPPASVSGECSCDRTTSLGSFLGEALTDDPSLDPGQIGMGAYIFCNRDLTSLEIALVGLDPALREAVLKGARDEALRQPP